MNPLSFDLFGELLEDAWKKEWVGMPEFIQEELVSFKEIDLRFETQEDVNRFSKLVGQNITDKTTYLWYPDITIAQYINKRYIDESK